MVPCNGTSKKTSYLNNTTGFPSKTNLFIHFCSISENSNYKDGSRLFFKDFFHDFLISSLFKDLIVGDAVIQNPFEWKVVSLFFFLFDAHVL